jgi:putative hemolysin
MFIVSVFSFVAVLLFTAIRASLSSALRLRLELESHLTTQAGKAAHLFITETIRVSLFLKTARTVFVLSWALSSRIIWARLHITSFGTANVELVVAALLISCFVFLLADLFVGNISHLHPYTLLKVVSPVFLLSYALFLPLTSLLFYLRQFIFSGGKKMRGPDGRKESGSEDFEELINSLQEGNPHLASEPEVQILQKALDFQDVLAGSCMIPRSEVVALEINSSIDVLIRKFTSTRLTRILIYRESIENIIGYVHSFELFLRPVSIISLIRPVVVVPETIPVQDLLTLFIKQRRNIAVVVDEYGGTSGILTMEDVIEELFGEIDDEHDSDQLLEKKLNEKHYLFSARLQVSYLNEKYGFEFPESKDYGTLGGLVVHLGEGLPRTKQRVFSERFRLEVTEMNGNRVETVKIILK